MEFGLNNKQKEIQELAKRFTDEEIIPRARQNDIDEHFPIEILKKMGPLGLMGGTVPKEWGGSELDFVSDAIIFEEVGRGCSSLRTILSVQVSLVEQAILNWGTEEQKRKYLPGLCRGELLGAFAITEPEAGSDAGSLKTTAQKVDGGWLLNGVKTWISNGGMADVLIIFARVGKEPGSKAISAFIVEKGTEGFTTREIKGKLGLKAANTAVLFFKDSFVPEDALLGNQGEGFKIALSCLDNGRFGVASGCVGIIQACIDASTQYAKKRVQFGKSIASFQLVQDMIAKMVVDRDAARLLVYRAAELKNKGVRNTLESSIAKYFASEAAVRAATDAIQIHGAYGYSNAFPVERYLRDAKVATIYEGTSQIQKLIIGEHTLGVRAFF
ncbi:MAG: acyl-CoA dehydrogenase family protein [Deltaproteobacteria bacterium]|nr:acyl-CoA dehydrogenase family protein [Deltaproteobacteria bacterium]